jgi:hypothetical protein
MPIFFVQNAQKWQKCDHDIDSRLPTLEHPFYMYVLLLPGWRQPYDRELQRRHSKILQRHE